jgi:hypothetical protein
LSLHFISSQHLFGYANKSIIYYIRIIYGSCRRISLTVEAWGGGGKGGSKVGNEQPWRGGGAYSKKKQ